MGLRVVRVRSLCRRGSCDMGKSYAELYHPVRPPGWVAARV
jgi:hypothetical protein